MFGRFDQTYRRWLLGRLDRPLSTVELDVGAGVPLWSLLDSAEPRRVAVLGRGKTTLLQQTARRLAHRSRLSLRRTVPVLIDLPTHAGRIVREPTVALVEVIGEATADLREAAPSGWWQSARCVLLLDGLDRVVPPEDRAVVAGWIDALRGHHVVVTGEAVAGFPTVRIRPPTDDQLRELVPTELPLSPEFRADPLLLGLAVAVHRERGVLPGTPAGLYSAAVPPDDALDALAFELMLQRASDPGRFAHRSFQEYRAARHIHRHGREAVLIEGLGDGWWRGVTLWWATMATVDPVVEAGLDSSDPAVLSLVFRCAEEAAGIGDALAERMRGLLAAGYQDSARRRLVAAVEADRQLRPFVVTDDGTRVCRDPVSTNLYWLFRHDPVLHRTAPVPEPDGPGDPVPVPPIRVPTDLPPVRGVWTTDAALFVRWVNEVATTGPFRLPDGFAATPRFTVTTQDLVDAVAADVEPMLGHLLSLGIRARAVALERLLDLTSQRARRVVAGFHHRVKARLSARLTVAENRLADLRRMSPKELGLGIMQVNAERRQLHETITALRAHLDRLDDPHRVDDSTRRTEPNWEWAKYADEVVGTCLAKARDMMPDLGTTTAIRDVDTALRLDRQLNDLYTGSAELHARLDPDAATGTRTHQDIQRATLALRRAVEEARQMSAALDTVRSTNPPTVTVEPLLRSVEWEGVPDPSDPARSAAAVLRRPLGSAFAAGMGRLLTMSRTTPDPVALCHAFAHGLVTGAGFSDGRRMTVRLDECAAEVAELYAHPSRNRFRQRLLAHAGPVFDRTGRRDPATLAAIRLYALILAGGQSAPPMRHLAAATVMLGRQARETLTLLQD